MIIVQCPYCKCVFAINDRVENDLLYINCPNETCRKQIILSCRKEGPSAAICSGELFQKVSTYIVECISKLDKHMLNKRITLLSQEYNVGNVLICEIANAILNNNKEEVPRREDLYFLKIVEETLSLQDLIEKNMRQVQTGTIYVQGDDITLRIANQRIEKMNEENSELKKRLECMKEKNALLKEEISRLI